MEPAFTTMHLHVAAGIARVVFDNPPMNLLDNHMFDDLDRLGAWLQGQEVIRVVVFESADEDFFIAHADLSMLEGMPLPDPACITGPSPHQSIFERFRTLQQLTIGKLRGIARGGGSEFLLALDLRYGALGRAVLGQPEVHLGFPPGCGATQRLPRLIGRSHALEAILTGRDYTAQEAARIGWLDQALPDAELDGFVDSLAASVASSLPHAVFLAKQAIDRSPGPLDTGLAAEFCYFMEAFGTAGTKARLRLAMEHGLQTRSVERQDLGNWARRLGDPADLGSANQ